MKRRLDFRIFLFAYASLLLGTQELSAGGAVTLLDGENPAATEKRLLTLVFPFAPLEDREVCLDDVGRSRFGLLCRFDYARSGIISTSYVAGLPPSRVAEWSQPSRFHEAPVPVKVAVTILSIFVSGAGGRVVRSSALYAYLVWKPGRPASWVNINVELERALGENNVFQNQPP